MSRVTDRVRDGVGALTGDGREWVLVAVATGWLFVLGTRVIVPAVLPQVQSAFGFSPAVAGLLVSALWVAYALTQFPGGLLADRIGERPTLAMSALLSAGGALALAASPTLAVFVLGVVCFGLGSGFYAPPRVTVLSRIYADRDGTALGVTFAVGNVGASLLPPVAGALAVALGWRFGFLFVVPPLVVAALALWWFVPEPDDDVERAVDDPARVGRRLATTFRDGHVLRTWTAMTLALFAYQGVTAFLPTYLVAVKGLSTVTATTLYGLLFASGAVAQTVAGSAADRYGARRVLLSLSGFGVLTLVALPVVGGVVPLAVLTILVGTRLGLGPVGNGYAADILPDDIQGSGYGLFRTCYLLVGALGSSFVGVLAGMGHFDGAFLGLAAVTALAAVGYYTLPPSEKRAGTPAD